MTTKLRAARIAADLRQSDVADYCGTFQSAVAKWEQGHARPKWANRRKLEQLFGLPHGGANELLNEETSAASGAGS